jgi:hypothetical protein
MIQAALNLETAGGETAGGETAGGDTKVAELTRASQVAIGAMG